MDIDPYCVSLIMLIILVMSRQICKDAKSYTVYVSMIIVTQEM